MTTFPGRTNIDADQCDEGWQRSTAAASGFSGELQAVIEQAINLEINAPTDLAEMLPTGKRHPNDRPLGPLKPRGKPSGIVVKGGCLVAQYGDVVSPEVTFSATKSYISALAGIAMAKGLITDLDEAVSTKVKDGGFESEQNSTITWRHLLQQTSEWEGELFGIPDWIDRGRQVGSSATMGATKTANENANKGESSTVGGSAATTGNYRELQEPGSFWEYNDVRVNRTALALLRLFSEPLPEVARRDLFEPMGASDSWQWHGYDTSWVDVEGKSVQSVSGGAHWGGGLWISTLDHARFGLLFLNKGRWQDRQILAREWVDESVRPCDKNPGYGLLWWLNHDSAISNVADSSAFAARGAGGNIVFVWPTAEIVITLRWCADTKKVIDDILECLL